MTSTTVTNTCGGQPGKLCFTAVSFDAAWSLMIGTAYTKPSQGSASNPSMLFILQCTSQPISPARRLTISFSDDNFGPLAGTFQSSLSGHLANGASQPISYDCYYDPGNVPGAMTWPLTASGTFTLVGNQETNIVSNSELIDERLCSVTHVLTIEGTPSSSPAASYSFNILMTFNPVPAPSLGLGAGKPLTSSGLALTLRGTSGVRYRVDASSDLLQWTTITNFVSTGSIMNFQDSEATNYARRFYRAVTQ
jgi:hypothetical protein